MRLTFWSTVVFVLVIGLGRADGYPEFQFSTGTTRCSECHFSPVGGGLINDYGRDEAATTISGAGDGRFAHGLFELPTWLALGGDLRVAALGKHVRQGTETAVFPMQADVYARVARGNVSAQATFGVLAAIRKAQPLTDRLGSREHYILYQAESREWYVRAGRFFPMFGLRIPDHTAYVRRYTGLHTLEESYAASGGLIKDTWEAHVTLLTPLELAPRVGRHGWGGAFHIEHITGDGTGSWSLHGKALHDDGSTESWAGGAWKRWLSSVNLLLSVELDGGVIHLDGANVGRLVGYANARYRAGKSWSLALGAHHFDPDLRARRDERAALDIEMAWFPRAHFEVSALLRASTVAFEISRGDFFGLLQLHYYL